MQRETGTAGPEGAGSTFEQFLDFVPDAIVGVGREGKIALVNARAEKLFGYSREELIGQSVEMLVPEHLRETHPQRRENYVKEPRARPMGAGIDLFAVRKDGTEFPVEIDLSSIETADGMIATAIVRDIGERVELGLATVCGIRAERHLHAQSITPTRRSP